MRCPNCATLVVDSAENCPECGADFHLHATETPQFSFETAPLFSPGDDFAQRYTVIEMIGQGGMGMVYKATDRSLQQQVALKLIRADKSSFPEFRERFKQEVRLAREISHPNVCRVHDLGEVGNDLYLSMAWINGVTLRRLLRQTRTLSHDRALTIAEKIARGLEAAHSRKIVHRDLKPENVMIDDRGEVFIMDFGLATASVDPGGSTTTAVVGTRSYMAPEQARGQRVDGRADLYALGLMLHEMVTGQLPPVRGSDSSESKSSMGSRLAYVVSRLAAEDPERRYPTAGTARKEIRALLEPGRLAMMSGAIRRVFSFPVVRWGGIALLLVLAVLVWQFMKPRPVVPVPGQARAFYERGLFHMTEDSESTERLDEAIGMFNRSLSVHPEYALALAGLGEAYWIRFDRTGDSEYRNEATDAVDKALALAPGLPEALNARARGLIAEAKWDEARQVLEDCLSRADLDRAWANLGRVLRNQDNHDQGLRAVKRAISLNPGSHQFRIDLGLFHEHFDEYEEAEKAYREAIELKPDSQLAWNNLGAVLLVENDLGGAADAFETSISIKDNDLAQSNLGTTLYMEGKFEAAAEHYARAAELDPDNPTYPGNRGDALVELGRRTEGREAFLRAVSLAIARIGSMPESSRAHSELGFWCGRAGLSECAEKEAELAKDLRPLDSRTLLFYAATCATVGRTDDAFEWLEKGVGLGLTRTLIEMEPAFEPLRNDARYTRILDLAG